MLTSLSVDGTQALKTEDLAEKVESACICMRTRQLSRIVTQVYDTALRPLGITASQLSLLALLAMQDGILAVDMARELDMEKSTLSRNLDRLETSGLLKMDPPAGRHGRSLHLTPKGEDIIKAAYPVWQEAQFRIIAATGTGTKAALETLISAAAKLSR